MIPESLNSPTTRSRSLRPIPLLSNSGSKAKTTISPDLRSPKQYPIIRPSEQQTKPGSKSVRTNLLQLSELIPNSARQVTEIAFSRVLPRISMHSSTSFDWAGLYSTDMCMVKAVPARPDVLLWLHCGARAHRAALAPLRGQGLPCRAPALGRCRPDDHARSYRSRFITLAQAATKSRTKAACASLLA